MNWWIWLIAWFLLCACVVRLTRRATPVERPKTPHEVRQDALLHGSLWPADGDAAALRRGAHELHRDALLAQAARARRTKGRRRRR